MPGNKFVVRKAKLKDIDSIVPLIIELGYPAIKDEVFKRLKKIFLDERQDVFVAGQDKVVGWMHISLIETLESGPFAEILGIVVNEKWRGKGAGTRLISTAAEWAKKRACKRIRIRTNVKRINTREYYRNLGFVPIKTQEVFEKEI